MSKFIDKVQAWVGRWIPGMIAWPLYVIGVVVLVVVLPLLLPPDRFKQLLKEYEE